MKNEYFKVRILYLVLCLIGCGPNARKHSDESGLQEAAIQKEHRQLRNGDIIFQTSTSSQSKAIQLATRSKYSHCGLIFKGTPDTQNFYVLEAVQPVKWTPLKKWIARGRGGNYVVKRVHTDPVLPPPMLEELRTIGKKYVGKDYDLAFGWNDDKMYCSELVWKIYKRATGIEVGELQKLGEFDLTSELVRTKLKERYRDKIPMNEPVISPAAIFESEKLILIEAR